MRVKFIVMSSASWMGAVLALSASANLPAQSVHANPWPGTSHPATRNPAVELKVTELLAAMTLEEKVAQMMQADIAFITPQELRRYKFGGVLAGGNAAPGNDLHSSPLAWRELTDEFHRAALADPVKAHVPIPVLFGIDAVHGDAKVRGATIFPHNIGLGAAHDAALIRRIGAATAAEVAATGVDWTFAPTVAVVRDVRWGRSYESYSESPALVASYAPAMVVGLQGELGTPGFMGPGHTLSSVKHFVGDGGTRDGRDQGDTVVPEAVLAQVHGAGYAPAIDAGALIVMASYNSWNGVKMHANHHLLTDVLKGRMGFDGFVVGDWDAQEQLPGCTKASCAAAILAGVDMLMAPDSWRELYEATLAQARSGEIPAARIEDAVRRILRVKLLAGLFARPAPPPRDAAGLEQVGSAEHRRVAREAVRKSLVLLKNAQALLPLRANAHVLVAGAAADDIGVQAGGWSVDWQGDHNVNADFPGATSIFAGLQAALGAGGGSAVLSPDGTFEARPDVAIVVFGEEPYAEFEGDRENLDFSRRDPAPLALLRRLRAAHIPTVSVFLSGRPLWVNPELNASDAFVAAWLPGSEGAGIADLLVRAADGSAPYDFTGRLSFSWPATAMPVVFDAAGQVRGALFPVGYGLDSHDPGAKLATLSEEPQIAAPFDPPSGSLFFAGHATAPWSLFVSDAGAQVHVTGHAQASPHGAVRVTLEPGGAAEADWNGSQPGMISFVGRAIDLRPELRNGAAIEVRYRVEQAPDAPVGAGIGCEDPSCGPAHAVLLDVTAELRAALVGEWRTLAIPLACLHAEPQLAQAAVPFALATGGHLRLSIAAVRVAAAAPGGATPCPPSVATRH